MDKNKIIERLYLDHKDHIYNFIARMTNDPDLALDITQQTFVKALGDKNITQINNPKAYLFTIARNTVYNEFKRKKASSLETIEENTGFETVDETEGVQQATEVSDLQRKVEQTINRMPTKVRELMILRYTEDLSIKEIATVTGRTLSDVKVNLHRARIKFESAFSHEMYAKVAVSRDQCDTLTSLLAPHSQSEIPEQHLQLVDKHIRSCKVCSDDVEQLKRSKVLFNLAALISAPYILDKMMSQAMASELGFMIGRSASSAKATISKVISSNTISTKVAIVTIAAVIGLAGFFIINSFFDHKPVNDSGVNQTQSTTTTITPLAKIDPAVTTIVSFKALDKKTGVIIQQGLQWDIFNTADYTGKAVSGETRAVQSSSKANFSAILNSGYYLAKVAYKGQTLESKFVVKDDSPLNVELSFTSNSKTQKAELDNANLPTIHIRRKQEAQYEARILKTSWDQCANLIDLLKTSRREFPQLWSIQEKNIKDDTPDFNLDRGVIPEPDWLKVIQNYEDEYFSANKYAIYKKGARFNISDNGSCKLIKTEYETADIDDGEFRYDIDFIAKTAEKNISDVITEKMTENISRMNPAQAKIVAQAFLGDPGSAQQQKSIDAITQFSNLTKIVKSETIAGETCEYTLMGEQMRVHICLWKTMHQYPSFIKRDIILKTSIELNNGFTAIKFEKNIELDNRLFSVPANITINDISAETLRYLRQ